jgi:hypothetical protein
MRNGLFLIASLFATTNIAAQITLTQSSYPASVTGTDSLKQTTYASPFPALAFMTNGMWDMSMVADTTPVFFAYRIPATGYQFADSNIYSLFGYGYQGNVQANITSGGLFEYASKIEKTNYSLISITGVITDSLFIDSQIMVYSSPRTKIAFPTTYSSTWSSTYSSDFNFQLSLSNPLFTYNHAPGIVRRYTTEKDSVLGWGRLRVKDASGSASPYHSVLQVKTIITTTDSFFINGSPFSTLLLSALSITQGKETTTYQQNYYRPEEVTALAQITFTDSTYSHAKSATTHIQRLSATRVAGINNEPKVRVYPNPVTGRVVSVDLPDGLGTWTYELIGITGAIFNSGKLITNGNHSQFTLPSSIISGSYYLRLSNNEKILPVQPITVLK